MTSVNTIEAGRYTKLLAETLKKSGDFEQPAWISFVKSGAGRMRPINDPDFWYKRAASILRQMYIKGVVGVGRLRTRYGNRKNKGMKPAHFYKGGGKIIRVILQQAESAGLMEKVKGTHSGRKLTTKGKELLDGVKI